MFGQQHQLSNVLHPSNIAVVPDHQLIPTLNRKCGCLQSTIIGHRNVCLITRQNLRKDVPYLHHLFTCEIEILDNTVVYFFTKSTADEPLTKINVTLLVAGYNGSTRIIKLLADSKVECVNNTSLLEVTKSDDPDIIEIIQQRHQRVLDKDEWKVRYKKYLYLF